MTRAARLVSWWLQTPSRITTVLELKRGMWWRWYMLDGNAVCCVLEPEPWQRNEERTAELRKLAGLVCAPHEQNQRHLRSDV